MSLITVEVCANLHYATDSFDKNATVHLLLMCSSNLELCSQM